jgi:hypothetical protein
VEEARSPLLLELVVETCQERVVVAETCQVDQELVAESYLLLVVEEAQILDQLEEGEVGCIAILQ